MVHVPGKRESWLSRDVANVRVTKGRDVASASSGSSGGS